MLIRLACDEYFFFCFCAFNFMCKSNQKDWFFSNPKSMEIETVFVTYPYIFWFLGFIVTSILSTIQQNSTSAFAECKIQGTIFHKWGSITVPLKDWDSFTFFTAFKSLQNSNGPCQEIILVFFFWVLPCLKNINGYSN